MSSPQRIITISLYHPIPTMLLHSSNQSPFHEIFQQLIDIQAFQIINDDTAPPPIVLSIMMTVTQLRPTRHEDEDESRLREG